MSDAGKILIVDDEPSALKVLSAILKEAHYSVFESLSVEGAVTLLRQTDIDAIITDLKMPGKDGFQLFQYILETHSEIPVIFLTAFGTVESAVNLMNDGAFYYFIKPPDYVKLKKILAKAVEQRLLRRELLSLRHNRMDESRCSRLIGRSPQMNKIVKTIDAVKDTESSVLITGETGTGKEVIAMNLHYLSKRYDKPFIAVNCAAIPKELIESELFGYERGAFSGAVSRRTGKIEEAADGTLFLDEIGELELSLQAKLLRVLQEKEIERLGSNKKMRVNFRLISSTNRNLINDIKTGNFRGDLFYRINVVPIEIPPVREREGDIPLLTTEILREFCVRENKLCTLSDDVLKIFKEYSWPGNVRQMRNVIERAVVLLSGTTITKKELPEELLRSQSPAAKKEIVMPLKELELQAIKDALSNCKGNKSKAARQLGISRKAFYKRLREYNVL